VLLLAAHMIGCRYSLVWGHRLAQVALIARISRITFCAAAPTACGLAVPWLFAVKVAQKAMKSAVSSRNSRDSGGVFGMGTAEDRELAPVARSRDIWPSFLSAVATPRALVTLVKREAMSAFWWTSPSQRAHCAVDGRLTWCADVPHAATRSAAATAALAMAGQPPSRSCSRPGLVTAPNRTADYAM
jgi:hypothetical protein